MRFLIAARIQPLDPSGKRKFGSPQTVVPSLRPIPARDPGEKTGQGTVFMDILGKKTQKLRRMDTKYSRNVRAVK